MGKLRKAIVLLLIIITFALLIMASRALFFNNETNHSNGTSHSNDATLITPMASQSFGRAFIKAAPLGLEGSERLGQVADPNYNLSFPKDHYSHDLFDIEWWYLTANLEDDEGKAYGLQWTLFRFRNLNVDVVTAVDNEQKTKENMAENALKPENESKGKNAHWSNEHFYMAHASIHSESQHWFSEKFARGNVGNAGIEQTPFKLFIDDWQWASPSADLLPSKLTFNAKLINSAEEDGGENENGENSRNTEASYLNVQLNLSNTGPYVLQGQNGYSIKSANGKHASHYYSAPFINIEGTFTMSETDFNAKSNNVKPSFNESDKQIAVKGKAWFDQEWTSQLFDQATQGWDWLSLHLDNGDKIMAFRMRLRGQPDYVTGTYIDSDGSTTTLKPSDIKLNPIELTQVGNKKLPLYWQLKIESKEVDVSIKATKNDQWNPASIAYYEGTVKISGTHKGKGFLELTGY